MKFQGREWFTKNMRRTEGREILNSIEFYTDGKWIHVSASCFYPCSAESIRG